MDVAPIEIFSHGRYDSDNQLGQIVIGTQRAMPVFDLLPQVSADSYFDMLRVVVGVQFDEETNKKRFRYRLTALETEVQKTPWGTHFTFLDYNATGLEDLWADWLAVSLGPGFNFGTDKTHIVVRAMGHAAFNTYRFGEIVFGDLGDPAGETRTGGSFGGSGGISLVLIDRLLLRGNYDLRFLTAGPDSRKDQIDVILKIEVGKGWGIFGTFSSMTAEMTTESTIETGDVPITELSKVSQTRTAFGGGLRFSMGN
jgi:hypothetical protein